MSEVCPSHDPTPLLAAREDAPGDAERRSALRVVKTPARARRLLLCLDGVPFDVVTEAKSRGLFENFKEPARLLSPFPTLTNVALAEMLGATPPNGYESLYFDREAKELRGGVRKYIGWRTPDKVPSSYMDELDYQEPLAFEFLIYVATEAVWKTDMRRFRERFLAAPPDRDFFGFLKATDGLLHIGGPARLIVALQSLDRLLREIQKAAGAETEIVLFSDHGMNLEENRRLHLQTHLKRCGYEVVSHMRRPRGKRRVSAPGFGLCGYAALYCGEETDRAELADALRELEGVDFSVHRDESEGAAIVTGARGRASIRREQSEGATLYRYEQLSGDPLGLAQVARALSKEGRLDERGYAASDAWLDSTARHEYPDAPANLYESVYSPRVRHTADVLVSLSDGYYYGANAFSHMVRLLATHGNALRSSTTAFLMSTHRNFPGHVRSSEARPFLRG
ncbi:MAG TPA: alkaline phosphatase family protein [Pyrinomonadaceae bacterium]|nr:alkaline phosphatase family protein [Pyrinomonadaceae bacterium]